MQNYELKSVTDSEFASYGRVLTGYDLEPLVNEMAKTPMIENVVYVPGVDFLEELDISREFQENFFGGLPIQVGYCNGYNEELTALEYHRSSEINIAMTDMILLLGKQQDISDDYTYNKELVEAFYVPAMTVVELYATTLHYAPVSYENCNFCCTVILPKGTNLPIEHLEIKSKEDEILAAKNKWLIELDK